MKFPNYPLYAVIGLSLIALSCLIADTTKTAPGPPTPPMDGPIVASTTEFADGPESVAPATRVTRYQTNWLGGSVKKVMSAPVSILGAAHEVNIYQQSGRVITGTVYRIYVRTNVIEHPLHDWKAQTNVVRYFRLEGTNIIPVSLPASNITTNTPQ